MSVPAVPVTPEQVRLPVVIDKHGWVDESEAMAKRPANGIYIWSFWPVGNSYRYGLSISSVQYNCQSFMV